MYRAFNDPKQLKELDPERHALERVIDQIQSSDLPSMLRIPKKKAPVQTSGN